MPNFEISDVREPVGKSAGKRSAFTDAVKSLPVGKALVIKGMAQSSVSSRANVLGKLSIPRRKFSTITLPNGEGIQLTRDE